MVLEYVGVDALACPPATLLLIERASWLDYGPALASAGTQLTLWDASQVGWLFRVWHNHPN